MKKLLLFALLVALYLFSGNSGLASNAPKNIFQGKSVDSTERRYSLKSGIVTFENETNGVKSFIIICFDNYGAREAIESKSFVKTGNHLEQAHTLEIYKGDTTLLLDLENRTGEQTIGIKRKSELPNFAGLAPQEMQSLGIIRNAPEEFLGKTCDVYVMHNERANIHAKYMTWNNIVIWSEINMAGVISRTQASSIRENTSISEANFETPLDIIPVEKY